MTIVCYKFLQNSSRTFDIVPYLELVFQITELEWLGVLDSASWLLTIILNNIFASSLHSEIFRWTN